MADADPQARAWWLTCHDGARLRVARLGTGEKGTVLLLPGRTEFVEKYGPAGRALAARGYGCLTLDWRGQGLADRPLPDRETGHVEVFDEYQWDLAAVLAALPALGVGPGERLVLLGHSMGGGIGLRALHAGLAVRSCVFSGPMWGILLSPVLRPVARMIVGASRPIGLGRRYAPGTRGGSYVAETAFADNQLTGDRETWAWLQRQVAAYPELRLGGPSNAWVHEALCEIRALHRLPPPDLPCLTVMGELERIIDARMVAALVDRWAGARIWTVPGARHEIMMETPDRREAFFDAACAHFDDSD